MTELDELDQAYVDAFLPEGAVFTGLFVIVSFLDSDGNPCIKTYDRVDGDVPWTIGLLELAKHRVLSDWKSEDEDDD